MSTVLSPLGALLRRHPYPLYSALRRVAPVLRVPGRDVWMLFDFESVKRALHDPETFSSRAAPPGKQPLDWLIFLDPPAHAKLRALIVRTFTPRAVAALEPRVHALAHGLLDRVIASGRMDLVGDFAERLPPLVIMELLGIPPGDAERVTRWTAAILGLGDTVLGGEHARRAREAYAVAKEEMRPRLAGLLAERRVAPRDDLLTRLVDAEVDEERLTEEEIFAFFQLLLLAGTETTANLIANAVLCFAAHPAQYARLRAEPALLPAAIEEVVRYRTPVQMVFRQTTRAVTLRGRTIPAGTLVLPMVGAANRDPAHFRDASRFDIGRAPVPHVGFGHGIHYCLGAALARLEARVALDALLARVQDLRVPERRRWVPRAALAVHGPARLPVTFTPGVAVAATCPFHERAGAG